MEQEKTISILGTIDDWSHSYVLQEFMNTPIEQPIRILMFCYGGEVRSAYAIQALIIDECKKRIDKVRGAINGIAASATTIVSTGIPIGKLGIAATASYMIHNIRVEIRNSESVTYFTAKDIRDIATVEKETNGAFEAAAKKLGKSFFEVKQMLERFGIEYENETGLGYEQLFKLADQMDEEDEKLINLLARRSGQTPEQIRAKYFDGEDHNLTAEQAVSERFCDYVQDFAIPEPSLMEEILTAKNSKNKEDYFRLVTNFNNNFFNFKIGNDMNQDLLAEKKQGVSVEPPVLNEKQLGAWDQDMLQANQTIAKNNEVIHNLREELQKVSISKNELNQEFLAKIAVLEQQLNEANGRAVLAESRLVKEKETNEYAVNLVKYGYSIGQTEDTIVDFVETNILAIEAKVRKTANGFIDNITGKIVAQTAEEVVKQRIELIRPSYSRNQNQQSKQNIGSGYSPQNQYIPNTGSFVTPTKNLVKKQAIDSGIPANDLDGMRSFFQRNGYDYDSMK